MTNPKPPTRETAVAEFRTRATELAHTLMKPLAESLEVKTRCRRRTMKLVHSGRLVKEPCEACGAAEVVAHHENYRRAEHVRWVCRRCHQAVHHRGTVLPGKLPRNPTRDEMSQWIAVLVLRMVASMPEQALPAAKPAPPTLFLTVDEAAVVSGLSARYLRQAIKSGELAARKTSQGYRIRRKDLEAL